MKKAVLCQEGSEEQLNIFKQERASLGLSVATVRTDRSEDRQGQSRMLE